MNITKEELKVIYQQVTGSVDALTSEHDPVVLKFIMSSHLGFLQGYVGSMLKQAKGEEDMEARGDDSGKYENPLPEEK